MGKLQKKPKWSPKRKKGSVAKRPQDDILIIHRNPNPSPEQTARYQSLRKWLAQRLQEAARMSPQESKKADEDWEKFKQSVNQGRYRKVILD
jgi:hypothetical protein